MAGNAKRGPRACTAVPLNNTQLAHRGSWIKRNDREGRYQESLSKSRQKGAKLIRRGVRAKRLAIVVTKCPSCGKIVVRWRGKKLRVINLRASKRVTRKVIGLKTLRRVRKGKLVVVVKSRGKPVIIEGLGISRV